ncbi:LtfC-like domain-containing protein [Prescottella equi]|uniref:LtfC-like domain-containing protein n=1 Tax=Rhodococcus hoagii TaxID=43767 RepID=UPI00197F6E6F|nr:hypothetical protein [Prescottella equi]MBM4708157.1 hypothetical protein [Prescottella equi]NKT21581.1 hypothetical protein [Prescottella equi]NKU46767.1 hypothetical protein [Prescottella equi]NKU52536.1 hypothetical protein [Prescottella equi]NKU94077.1 hypothetical protein [Prescottella equi]
MDFTDIGAPQQRIRIWLKRGSPLRFALSPVALPASTTVTLEAGARTFPATVTTDSVSWRIEPADADLIPDRAVVRIRCVFLDDPTTVEPWLKGVVARDD